VRYAVVCQVESRTLPSIEIRPIRTHSERQAIEQLQREIWNLVDVKIVPDHMLVSVQKSGGLVLGAFESSSDEGRERLIGFIYGLVGLTCDGRVKHCSDMAGVVPAYQNQNVGYRLKLAQREHMLAQGIDLITWTFDPLESRNARLNFRKLGATCRTYLRNLYGSMRDELNAGLFSDRFQVEWHIASDHVADRLSDDWDPRMAGLGDSPSALQAEGVPVLNPALPGDNGLLCPSQEVLPIEGDRLLIQIPAHFQAIKAADFELARAWRAHTRALFEAAFAAGHTVVDLLFEKTKGKGGQSCYLLRKDWTLS